MGVSLLAWLKYFGFCWITDCPLEEVDATIRRIRDEGRYLDIQVGPPQQEGLGLEGIYGPPRKDLSQ
jgi:hypothetical protein